MSTNETRSGALKREVNGLRQSNANARQLLVSLASLPEKQALELFAQLRLTRSLQPENHLSEKNSLLSAPLQSVQQGHGDDFGHTDISYSSNWIAKKTTADSPQMQAWLTADPAKTVGPEAATMLLNTLVCSADTDCGALLARLRLGDNWESVSRDIEQGQRIANHGFR